MKLVIGIVRPEVANDVLEALYRAEVRGLSISKVQGHGGELDRVNLPRRPCRCVSRQGRFEIASPTISSPTIEASAAPDGEVGDGRYSSSAEPPSATHRLETTARDPCA